MVKVLYIVVAIVAIDVTIFAEGIMEKNGFRTGEELTEVSGYGESSGLGASVWIGFDDESEKGGSKDSATSIARNSVYNAHNKAKKNEEIGQATNKAELEHQADQAKQAAQTAIAALNHKKAIMKALQQSVTDAMKHINVELKQLSSLKHAAWAAQNAVGIARQQIAALASALNMAEHNVVTAERAAYKSLIEVGAQERLVSMAKLRAQEVSHQLQAARFDLHKTEAQASRASYIAANAASNVAAIAVHLSNHGEK